MFPVIAKLQEGTLFVVDKTTREVVFICENSFQGVTSFSDPVEIRQFLLENLQDDEPFSDHINSDELTSSDKHYFIFFED